MLNYLKYRFNEFFYGGKKIPIPAKALVLEIASGGKPYWRSNVLVDKFILDNSERDSSVTVDRDFVVADILKLPFKDKTFDFVIARHILEHVPEAEKFIKELQRVARAGYIETPSSFAEDLFGWPFHVWSVDNEQHTLLIKSKNQIKNEQLKKLKTYFDQDKYLKNFSTKNRDLFYTSFLWQDKISFKIEAGNLPVEKEVESSNTTLNNFSLKKLQQTYSLKKKIKIALDKTRRKFWVKNKKYELVDLLTCLVCQSQLQLNSTKTVAVCTNKDCHKEYPVNDGLIVIL